MGATGYSVARFLRRENIPFAVTDSRAQPPSADDLAALTAAPRAFGGFASPLPLSEIAEAVVSPGIALDEPFLQELRGAGVPIVGDVELFARAIDRVPSPGSRVPTVIAITGSNGKSTVTAWLAEVARVAGERVAAGGNFGPPALDLLADDVSLYVLELSSFQLELVERLACTAAVVLNISADHIDRHGDMAHYVHAKQRIYADAVTAVINADDARVAAMDTAGARVARFGSTPDCDYVLATDAAANDWLARRDRHWLACERLALPGRHNHFNALAVWALAEAAGLDADSIATGLCRFAGLAHRCQWVARIAGVDWINDSKGTNLGALLASLAGMQGPVILLAGGQAKGADFTPLAEAAAGKARAVIVFGEDAAMIAAVLANRVAVHRVDDLTAAVALAAELAETGDTVLLSPGCASLDQYPGYAARGDAFTAAVRELAA